MANESLTQHLEKLYEILQVENKALINNQGKKMEEIVAKKQEITKELEGYDLGEVDLDRQDVKSLVQKTRDLQETNLVLTKQAMNYADTFISAFQKEANKNITYSEKGKEKEAGSSSLLNRSL